MTVKEQIFRFNSNELNKKLKGFYNRKSFLEIISKARNENTHSSFLAWLFEGSALNPSDEALKCLLDLLASKAGDEQMPVSLQNAALTGKLRISDINATTEKSVKDLSEINSTDRLDIVIECKAEGIRGINDLCIVFENKIYSSEGEEKSVCKSETPVGKKYSSLSQTERYAFACKEYPRRQQLADKTFIFVYLTPEGAAKPVSKDFIHISYQELLDYVLSPILNSGSCAGQTSYMIEQYVRSLGAPAVCEGGGSYSILAVSENEKSELKAFWENPDNRELICLASGTGRKGMLTRAEDELLSDFWNTNSPLLAAVYTTLIKICPDDTDLAALFSTTQRDYSKYTLVIDGQQYDHLNKRSLVIEIVKALLAHRPIDQCQEIFNRMDPKRHLVYTAAEFDAAYKSGEVSDDQYRNRWSTISVNGSDYKVCNQWSADSIGRVLDTVYNNNLGIQIIVE